ncbi:MAG: DUF4167 domain-containing protein [Alphaproteobacteria bacterium]|nr:DUF4167 domain-containing protein [Alphaproteobacteria bacterium]
MRQGPNGRRPRSRHHGGNNGGGNSGGGSMGNRPRSAASLRHQSFDSNCGDLRVRGNAWQVHEKYQALARDASSSGDRVLAENYLQHAEHYYRIIEAIDEAAAAEQRIHGDTTSPFSQQPDVPSGYYTQAGSIPAEQPKAVSQPGSPQPQPQAQPEATVQQRTPPSTAQPSPFFTQEEIDEQNAEKSPLAAAR